MHRSDRIDGVSESAPKGIDWRSWVALGWVVVFGSLYARMVLETRAPGVWEAIRERLGIG